MSTNKNRLLLLNKAKFLALAENYEEALKIVNQLLMIQPNDLDGLRLKGNLLELEIYADQYADQRKFTDLEKQTQLTLAQQCYEQILKIDPNQVLALIDLGDHWQNQSSFVESLNYYNQALNLLKQNRFYLSLEDELIESFRGKQEILRTLGKISDLRRCQEEEQAILSNLQKPVSQVGGQQVFLVPTQK